MNGPQTIVTILICILVGSVIFYKLFNSFLTWSALRINAEKRDAEAANAPAPDPAPAPAAA